MEKDFERWIIPKRNHSTAHYHNSFFDYINDGYAEVSPTKTKNVLPSSISTGMTFLLICRNIIL